MVNSFHSIPGGVCAAPGFRASGVHCGIRRNSTKKDLALILADGPCAAAGVYTQNKVKGAPLLVTREHFIDGKARAILCNSGNANTCNADGVEKAKASCQGVAQALNISAEDVAVASTGVIGKPLPLEPILEGIPALCAELSYEGSGEAARAIMTTDTVPKEYAVEFTLGGKTCRLGGIAKGVGMIHPNMATLLCFLTTDIAISPVMLHKALTAAVTDTFNMVSIDGDTSTNDMALILAGGTAGNALIDKDGPEMGVVIEALKAVMVPLARMIAKDGEGATKLLECHVEGAPTVADAKALAKSVITSTLFKAAMFGRDANWGRILCALGYADAQFDIAKVDVALRSSAGKLEVCKDGSGLDFDEEFALKVLEPDEIIIEVRLNQGGASATAWGCDLTYEYVKINGEYRT